MKTYLKRISAACGIPDAAEACRVILTIVKEAERDEAFADLLKVKVSGSDVYKAVSNYLHHSEDIQYKIEKAIDEIVSKDTINDAVRKVMFAHFFSSRNMFESEIEEIVKKEVRKTIKEELKISEGMIKKAVGDALKKIVS